MRSRTSRGVPEWSGGEELYIGSRVSATGRVSGVTGIVPDHRMGPGGPPGGTTHPGGPHGLKWGGEPAHSGLVRPLGPPPAPRVGNPRVGGAPLDLGGKFPPLGRRPPIDGFLAGAPTWGAYIKGGGRGSRTLDSWRLPLPCYTSPSRSITAKPCCGDALHPPPRRRAAGSSSTSPSPLLDQEGGDVTLTVRVLNAEVPSVRR